MGLALLPTLGYLEQVKVMGHSNSITNDLLLERKILPQNSVTSPHVSAMIT